MASYSLIPASLAAAMLATAAMAADPAPVSAPAAVATPTAAKDSMDEMVCRKSPETGSLVKSKKTCHTRGQWAYIEDQNQALGRALVDDSRGRISGN